VRRAADQQDTIQFIIGDPCAPQRLAGQFDALLEYAKERFAGARQDIAGLDQLVAEREAKGEQKAFTLKEYGDVGPDRLRSLILPLTREITVLDERIMAAEHLAGMAHEDADGIVKSVIHDMREISNEVGKPTSAPLRSIVKLLTRTVVDVEAQEINVVAPDEAA
jgi:hypothetical protein